MCQWHSARVPLVCATDMDRSRAVHLSKLLALALRHEPSALGLALDANGWASVDDVLAGLARKGERLTRDELEEIVATSDKRRYALSLPPSAPPETPR